MQFAGVFIQELLDLKTFVTFLLNAKDLSENSAIGRFELNFWTTCQSVKGEKPVLM